MPRRIMDRMHRYAIYGGTSVGVEKAGQQATIDRVL